MRILLLFVAATVFATADVRLPPPIEKQGKLRIVYDSVGKDGPVLDIPAALADDSQRADILPGPPLGGGGGWWDVVSGFFLSIGAFFSGRAFWRKSKGRTKALIPAAIVAGSLLCWTELSQAQKSAQLAYTGPVKVRVMRTGSEVVLHLPAGKMR